MFTLMTFNIRYGMAEDGLNHWENRKTLVLERIRIHNPDLLGLQECRDDFQADFIKENLQEYGFFGVPRGGGGATALEMAPVLFKRSAFRIVTKGCFWLSETPDVAGSLSWGSTFPRTATWVQLIHAASGKELVYLNTHFDYEPLAIEASARLLQQWVTQSREKHPVIVTGDFNADKDSSAYLQLTAEAGLLDVFRQVHPDSEDEGTFHGYGQANDPIDWMLASDSLEAVSAKIDRFHAGNVYPSDHYPIHAELRWKMSHS